MKVIRICLGNPFTSLEFLKSKFVNRNNIHFAWIRLWLFYTLLRKITNFFLFLKHVFKIFLCDEKTFQKGLLVKNLWNNQVNTKTQVL
jgi:hypothetical protein